MLTDVKIAAFVLISVTGWSEEIAGREKYYREERGGTR
jgi:hypothetical protein